MKEHKNLKVLNEGLLWMVYAIDVFGVSRIKFKDLIDFCKNIGLQSNVAATRNTTIKLMGGLHNFLGPLTLVDQNSKINLLMFAKAAAGTGNREILRKILMLVDQLYLAQHLKVVQRMQSQWLW